MERLTFETENNELIKNSRLNIIEIKRLISFMKIFVHNFNQIINTFQKQLTIPKEVFYESILITNMNGMYNYFLSIMEKSNNIISKIVNDIISPLEQFIETQQTIYEENINKFTNLILKYDKCKTLLNYCKNKYYESSIKYYNFEKDNKKFLQINKEIKDKTIKMKSTIKSNELLYKYEIDKYNNEIIKLNNIYNGLNKDILINEESRISFIKTSIDKFKLIYDELLKNLNEYSTVIENYSSNDICEKDKKYFNKEIKKYYKGENRIPSENFISYKDYINQNLEFKIENSDNLYNENQLFPLLNEKDENNLINTIINELLNENEIQNSIITMSLEQLRNPKSNFAKKLLDNILNHKEISSSLKFTNLKNFEHFSNILSFITMLNDNLTNPNFQINFKIIFLAERIFYQYENTNDKIYLCAQLSKNLLYRTKTFWENIIDLKLTNKLEEHIERLNKMLISKEKNNKTGLFNRLGYSFKSKNDLHKTSIIGLNRISKLLKNYNSIDENKLQIIDKIAINELILIIKENIPSFCNFNFYADECLEMISDFSRQYNLNKEYVNYFFSYFNVSNFTIRKFLPNEKNYNISKNILRRNYNIEQKYLFLISNCLEFINNSDYLNLLLLSKKYNKKLIKKIYKIILKKKDTTINTRKNLWFNLLKINELKKEFNYEKILNSPTDKNISNCIKVDVLRTNFKNEPNEDMQNKISNILNSVSKLNGKIQYCQGMNYIVSFLLEFLSEEETFYIFLSFFKFTEYPLIFEKDLEKLKYFFYIFQRLISLFEPELSILFNSNGVNTNIFLPSWFITLFLNSRNNLIQKNTPISLIRILDNFIVSGWKSLMKVGIFILNNCENDIKKLKYENLMTYLMSDVKKSNLFSDENVDKLEKCFNNKKINKSLIKFIEDEYIQEKKINEIKEDN